jgi:SAM-dependent methyltransferase
MMPDRPVNSAHQRVVEEYFRTTSLAGCPGDPESFSRSVAGIRRRLGRWLDVRGKDVVDLGSGTGELCWVAREAGARSIVGVNLSQEEIDFSRRQVDVEFVRQDIAVFLAERAPESIDRIYALNILEHFDKDALVRVLEGAFRCLREGGQMIAMVPNATSPFGGMTRYWDITHQNAFTPSSVRQLSRLVGFGENVDFRECGPVPYGFISSIRFVLWQGIRLLIRGYFMVELASDKGGVYTADMLFRLRKPRRRGGEKDQ